MVVYTKAYPYENLMGNNLDKMIRRSGMTNTQVAEEKGIKRETLSRHKSGAINISRLDAEEYAQILDCTPQQIMYQSYPMPLLGYITPPNEDNKEWHVERDPRALWYSEDETMLCVFMNSFYLQHTIALKWADEIEDSHYGFLAGALFTYDMTRARCDKVDPEAIMRSGSLNRERGTGRLLIGAPYPVPGKKTFTIYNQDKIFPTYEDVDIEWSAPVLSANFRPDLRDAEIVQVPKKEINQGHWCDHHHDHYTDRKHEPYS